MFEQRRGRRLPVGAEVVPGGVHFRVWAPKRHSVEVEVVGKDRVFELNSEGEGYFSGLLADVGHGTLYRYRLDGGDAFPDPASRWQPEGPHGPSSVVDPSLFRWNDADWRGIRLPGQVIYEMHVGTFTQAGTWEAASAELGELAELGITTIEVMPVAEFPGRFGWGYDGVDLFAPTRLYGEPDDFRRFVDRAHSLGLGVILDVVYNHFGPDGAYHTQFSDDYFTHDRSNEWGVGLNFSRENCGPVREFFIANAGYWIDEYHLDGLRLDATQAIHDDSPEHVLAAIGRRAREAAGSRSILLIAENDDQDMRLVRPLDRGGYGLDAVWNDDFHHAMIVAITRRAEGYYHDFQGTPQELISALKWGYLFQGQFHEFKGGRRGTPTFGIPSPTFVNCLENHDQVSNSARGDRLQNLTSPGMYKAMTALLLLGPGTPMLFQGQEFAASSPFLYFADHHEELAALVKRGRISGLGTFRSLAHPEIQHILPDPGDPKIFVKSKLDLTERIDPDHAPIYQLHRDLLRLRREDPVFSAQRGDMLHGAVIAPDALALRFLGEGEETRLIIANLGRDLHLPSSSEPLLAPPPGMLWEVLWTSESPKYGGYWAPPTESEPGWIIPGHAAVVFAPREAPG